MKQIYQMEDEQFEFHERLQQELSSYPVNIIEINGSVDIQYVKNPYFLTHDIWHTSFLETIPQFQKLVEEHSGRQHVRFQIDSATVNLEIKYVWFHKLFKEEWRISSLFSGYATYLQKLTSFLNEKYPNLHSLLNLDIDQAEREWCFWLEQHGLPTQRKKFLVTYGTYTHKSSLAVFLRTIYSNLFKMTDIREEWEKDRWDVRELHNKYGIPYNKSRAGYFIDFNKFEQVNIRQSIKRYIKHRLINKSLAWGTAQIYLSHLPRFISLILSLEPSWTNLKGLKRSHMEQYIQCLNGYARNNLSRKNSNAENYISGTLNYLGKFLEDIQRYEYDIAPETHVRLLLFPEDKPKRKKKSFDQINYIPDFVLEQLFTHINDLHREVIPVVWVAYKTGLRISDVLGLTSNCLERLNGKYSIVTDIEKTYVQGHRIPIDEELAGILAVLIQRSKENSNQENNPEGYIFVHYLGARKGKPYEQQSFNKFLNILAHKKKIVDETGKIFHFKARQFRHTYAIKMLNGGADILTVQELLAHASPEMTLQYAKLLDDTKRKAFESVISQGVFSFDLNGEVQEVKAGEDIPKDILHTLWQNHKLNAMDNPYGTCHARLKGSCPHMEAPPCLTCNGGSPCKDLAIGFSEYDIQKYMLHVKTTSKSIEVAKQHGRDDVVEKQERNLQRYHDILINISEGNVIFGRQERMKRKSGVEK
ncbi:transposase [Bacillus thuringiensis]|uniref:tyrosine-type recombinase/integrase n=1 Tax=Bacillus thuringiensis TaxID=1428 RepID=UPI000676E464|nr:tyrosine-type recombinase/integrase [Bacillus thuringiensis]AKR10514.1 transposase [Bacillus thuringiensis]